LILYELALSFMAGNVYELHPDICEAPCETSEHNLLKITFIKAKIRTDIQPQQYRPTYNEY